VSVRQRRLIRRTHPLGQAVTVMALGGVLLVRSQVRSAYRRYALTRQVVGPIDLLILPAGSSVVDLPPVELAALGDSGMAGVGVREVEKTLPAQVARRVADRLGRPVHVVGYGRSGARTADVLAEQVPRVRGAVDVAVVLVGVNDVIRLRPWPRLAQDVTQLLDALCVLGAPVVLSSLPEFRAMTAIPPVPRLGLAVWAVFVRRLQQHIVRLRPDVVLVDVRGAVGGTFFRDAATMSPDAFHPSARGYGLIADALAPAVATAASSAPLRSERLDA